VIEIYAITDAPPATLPDAADLCVIANAGLVAFCGLAQERTVTPSLLWRHEQIVETLMKTCDLLPVRFGTQVEDAHAAATVLARQQDELKAALDRVRGAVELAVRVVDSEREPQPAAVFSSGADYMRAKAMLTQDVARVARAIHDPLAGMARASRVMRQVRTREALRSAYLVARDVVGQFVDRVSSLQRANPDLHVLCTGPWPPYSFVSE
jgi:hypothetical protein